jgi:phosphoribosylaminoimidazole-succinocarboxamide synthase
MIGLIDAGGIEILAHLRGQGQDPLRGPGARHALIQYFKDDATAFNNKKHEPIDGKGVLNNRISDIS